jgi:hypothetical protein
MIFGASGTSCGSNRRPSVSPSWNVWLEMPRLDENHEPPLRATKNAQKLLVLVQQLGGKVAGSPSTWQTASLSAPKATVLYSMPDWARTCSPVSDEPLNAMHRLAVDPSPCSTTRATWWLPVAASQVAAGLDQAIAVIGTWTATATATARSRFRRLSVRAASTRAGCCRRSRRR